MPLPTTNLEWPPTELKALYARLEEHDAWYSASAARLSMAYAGATVTTTHDQGRRSFWSKRAKDTSNVTRGMVHVPLAGELSAVAADALFSHPPTVTLDGGDQDSWDALVESAGLHNTWLEGAEVASALGGVYLRPTWDPAVSDVPFVTAVHPDAAWPQWSHGRLRSVIFWTALGVVGSVVMRHLELHEWSSSDGWVIEHALYAGTKERLGVRQDLTVHPATTDIEERQTVQMPTLGVSYVPNMLPNRVARRSPNGRSDYQGVEGVLHSLDETLTSWMRDIRLGKARIIVPEGYLQTHGPGEGQNFDEDREVFTPLNLPENMAAGTEIEVITFELRTADHRDTMLTLVERVASAAGYSPQDFGLNIEGRAESGTALRLRRSRSIATTAKKRRYWAPALRRGAVALSAIQSQIMKQGMERVTGATIQWSEEQDPTEVAVTVELLNRATAVSTELKVRMAHPDWNEQEVMDEVARIQGEQGLAVPDPII